MESADPRQNPGGYKEFRISKFFSFFMCLVITNRFYVLSNLHQWDITVIMFVFMDISSSLTAILSMLGGHGWKWLVSFRFDLLRGLPRLKLVLPLCPVKLAGFGFLYLHNCSATKSKNMRVCYCNRRIPSRSLSPRSSLSLSRCHANIQNHQCCGKRHLNMKNGPATVALNS